MYTREVRILGTRTSEFLSIIISKSPGVEINNTISIESFQ